MSEVQPGLVIGDYEFLEAIGEGGYSSVYRVRSLKFDRTFVAKVARVKENDIEGAWKAFDCEYQALLRLDHPNIIKLYGHFRHGNSFILILEDCRNGSLYDYMKKNGAVPVEQLVKVTKDICSALRYAWSHGVQHRDIKPPNILFDEFGRAKLVDFGISIVTEETTGTRKCQVVDFRCSPICAAPEILNRLPHDPVKTDIWALGVTILWMARGSIPWVCDSRSQMKTLIQYGQYTIPPELDLGIARIVRRMLALLPNDRELPSETELEAVGVTRGGGLFQLPSVSVFPLAVKPGAQVKFAGPVGAKAIKCGRRASASSLTLAMKFRGKTLGQSELPRLSGRSEPTTGRSSRGEAEVCLEKTE